MLQVTSPQLALDWVPVGQHSVADIELILEADEAQPLVDRIPLAEIDRALRLGNMQLFRVRPGPGVILTEIRGAFGHRRLCLIRGAGQMAHQLRSIFKLLDVARREWGCECVETVVYSHRLKRALELSGASVEGYVLTYAAEEPTDGQ